ncbi:MAG: glycosyltransferase family 39 protein [Acidobacteriaceae bacterium]|jgi:4-amino-4-deoxy-L-arabinose transferase-like glycosyltransferase
MTLIASPEPVTVSRASEQSRRAGVLPLLTALWLVLFFVSLFSPPVLDDADGTHANAARQILRSGDWVTLRVNNVRYLEKAPLPYWIAAASFRVFGCNTFATHLPQALAVLLLMLLGYRWTRESFGERAALYTGLGVLTSAGVFLFTRVLIPDVLLSLLLATALYCFLKSLSSERLATLYPYAFWTALALAVLTKGLVAIVFLAGTAIAYLALTGESRNWRRLRPFSGALLLLAIAAPWHILAGLRNTGGMDGHGFFWFYFVNEHVLRFLGRRIPRDYNKLPGFLYWCLHLAWLFPWSLFVPIFLADAVRRWRRYGLIHPDRLYFATPWILGAFFFLTIAVTGPMKGFVVAFPLACLAAWGAYHNRRTGPWYTRHPEPLADLTRTQRTSLLLSIFSFLVLAFFSLSTNQEYYTFPAYLPLLMLIAAALARAETTCAGTDAEARSSHRWITFAHAAFTLLGAAVAAALVFGLWTSRHLAALPDVDNLLAHRGVGDYTLSMSSLFDLTGPSFAALRLPAVLALAAFAVGPAIAWTLRAQSRHLAATTAIGLTSAVFLIAAHIALVRFAPMLSSQNFAERIQQLEATGQISRDNTLLLFGDQAYGSSIPFYLDRPLSRPALLVDGRSSSMLFGSTFPDAQSLFLTPADLLAQWGTGPRKLLFVPLERRDDVDRLLGSRQVLLEETSGKALITDRPLDTRPSLP